MSDLPVRIDEVWVDEDLRDDPILAAELAEDAKLDDPEMIEPATQR